MIFLKKNSAQPLYDQIFEYLRQKIVCGEMKKNSTLKPIRVLAEELNVSNNTINRAYQQLLSEGYISSIQGSGYYVEDIETIPTQKFEVKTILKKKNKKKKNSIKYDFNFEAIESDCFPWTKWRKYMQEAMLDEASNGKIAYECNKGNSVLRKSICTYINRSRGVKCDFEQIIICAGTQYAIDIITTLLPKGKNKVAFEDPGFNGMRQVFLNKGNNIKGIPMNDAGIDLDVLEKSDFDFLYLTPSHQFPTGITTSLTHRLKILDLANKNDAYIIENDYDNEFLYGKEPLPAIQALDQNQRVIYVSTLSKVLSPSLRCAYFVLPYDLLQIYEEKYKYYHSALPTYNQVALAHFIQEGHLERHVRKMALLNRKKCGVFSKIMMENLTQEVSLFPVPAGSHILITVNGCKHQQVFIQKMAEKGLKIYSTKGYWIDPQNAPENLFMFGYNALEEDKIEEACIEFCCVIKEIMKEGC